MDIDYSTENAPTLADFHSCSKFVRGVRGPIGSGKSVACCMEIVIKAMAQKPGPDGVSRSRWAIIRGTYPELVSTTIKTWSDWVKPEYFGPIRYATPITHRVMLSSEVELEVIFLALERDQDVKKLLSLELTGAWINEAKEVPESVLQMLTGRVGRYPAMRDGGASWSGVILDTNSPDDDHWWYRLAEEEKPEGYEFFTQPGGLTGFGENIPNLPGGIEYYRRQLAGKPEDWIKVFIHGLYGSTEDGKPVYPEWHGSFHIQENLAVYRGLPLIIGVDFGLTPAAAIGQVTPRGQMRILSEVVTEDMGIRRFIEDALKPVLATEFPGMRFTIIGDPAGAQRAQTDERTCFDEFVKARMPAYPAPTNVFATRREAVANYLTKHIESGPGFLIDSKCTMLIKGFNGRYKYRRMQLAGTAKYTEKPEKNEYSHVHDGCQYLCLGSTVANIDNIGELPPTKNKVL